jgi:ribosomal protein S18
LKIDLKTFVTKRGRIENDRCETIWSVCPSRVVKVHFEGKIKSKKKGSHRVRCWTLIFLKIDLKTFVTKRGRIENDRCETNWSECPSRGVKVHFEGKIKSKKKGSHRVR